MNKIDRYKSLIRYIIASGIAASQKDLAFKIGYTNESSFSQIINGKVKEPKDFMFKLKSQVPDLNIEWLQTGVGDMLNPSIPIKEEESEPEETKKPTSPCEDISETVRALTAALKAKDDALKAKDDEVQFLRQMLKDLQDSVRTFLNKNNVNVD